MSPSKEEKQIKTIKKELEKGKAPHIDPPKKKKTTTAAGTKKPAEAAAAEEEAKKAEPVTIDPEKIKAIVD